MDDQNKDEFVRVAETKDIQTSQMKEVQIDGEDVCIANVDGKYYAIGNVCTHEGGPLADGALEGYEVECPWHQSKFDVRTGKVTSPPASESEPTYEIRVDGSSILVKKRPTAIEKEQQQQGPPSRPSSIYELSLLEKQKFEATDVMSFRFSKKEKQKQQQGRESDDDRQGSFLDYTAEEQQGAQDTSFSPTRQQWTGERGRIDRAMLTKHLTDDEIRNSIFYTCGPPGMIKAMQDLIQKDLKVPKDRIKVEEFTGY